jgi:hypothetical protein
MYISIYAGHRPAIIETVHAVKNAGCRLEEEIVEIHDIRQTAIVCVKNLFPMSVELIRHPVIQKLPGGTTLPVNTLLDITYNKAFSSLGFAFMKQRAEIAPLHSGRILELIQKEMLVTHTQLLIHERSIRPIDYIT